MNILITGAAGFVGGYLSQYFSEEGHFVYGLDRVRGETEAIDRFELIECDLGAPLLVDELPESLDVIVHLAFADVPFPDRANEACAVNLMGTQRLLDYGWRAGIQHFVYASSGAIYGFGAVPFREVDEPRPLNYYAMTKYCAELLIRPYQEFFHTTILRLFFPYGKGQQGRLLPRLVQSVRDQQEVTIYGEGKPRINPIHISDVLSVIDRVVRLSGHHVLNVGGKETFTIKEIADLIGKLLGQKPVYRFLTDASRQDIIGDISTMKSLLDFEPKVCLAEGLEDMI